MTPEQMQARAEKEFPTPNELDYQVGAADLSGEVYDYTHPSYYDDKRIAEAQRTAFVKGMQEMARFNKWVTEEGWHEHSSKRYFYKSKDFHQWPPDETADHDELFAIFTNQPTTCK